MPCTGNSPVVVLRRPTVGTARQHGVRILVADDEASSRSLIEAFVQHGGYTVLLAENGRQALEVADRDDPNLILLDCQMPDSNGFEVAARLRTDARFDDTPIMFLTALDSAEDKAKGFTCGGVDYITKPVERAELLARIGTHLELARSRRQLRQQARQLESQVQSQSGRLLQLRSGQAGILTDPATLPGLNAAVRFQSVLEAGGDFYDILQLAEDVYGVLVADIAGHDLGVAHLTGAFKALSVSFTSDGLGVDETMLLLNAALRKFLAPGLYATACYAKFSRARMAVDLICAGHPAPLLQRTDGTTEYIELIGDPLGMFETVQCGWTTVDVKPGDRLFLQTDGLIEGYADPSGRPCSRGYGAKRLSESIEAKRGLGAKETVDAVVNELLRERGRALSDDVVLLAVEF